MSRGTDAFRTTTRARNGPATLHNVPGHDIRGLVPMRVQAYRRASPRERAGAGGRNQPLAADAPWRAFGPGSSRSRSVGMPARTDERFRVIVARVARTVRAGAACRDFEWDALTLSVAMTPFLMRDFED